jgi:uncharacterized protein YecE (DUF72 family)
MAPPPSTQAETRSALLRVGTAGWGIASRYADRIPTGGTHLERYAQVFNAVEIDSSFTKRHRRSTYARWADSVGSDFRFAVKTPKAMTHDGSLLTGKSAVLDQFLEEISGLGAKLGVVLVQMPPSLAFDESRVGAFFADLTDLLPVTVAVACEPRHDSWSAAKADALLDTLRVSRVAADPARFGTDAWPGGDRRLAYFRLHGHPRIYYSNYEPERLETLRRDLRQASRDSDAVWCVFDNTAHGHALGNALSFGKSLACTTR